MNEDELVAVKVSLEASHRRCVEVLAACSVYVDARAAEGDPLAEELSRMIAEAFTHMAAENIAAASLIAYNDGN